MAEQKKKKAVCKTARRAHSQKYWKVSSRYLPCWPVFAPQIIGDDLPPPPALTENESVTQSPAAEPLVVEAAAATAGAAIANVWNWYRE